MPAAPEDNASTSSASRPELNRDYLDSQVPVSPMTPDQTEIYWKVVGFPKEKGYQMAVSYPDFRDHSTGQKPSDSDPDDSDGSDDGLFAKQPNRSTTNQGSIKASEEGGKSGKKGASETGSTRGGQSSDTKASEGSPATRQK